MAAMRMAYESFRTWLAAVAAVLLLATLAAGPTGRLLPPCWMSFQTSNAPTAATAIEVPKPRAQWRSPCGAGTI